ncbi:hypothetical protein [Nostoc mirabile]|nr:hypothetical protein [Nostoc mirabile]
MKPGKFSSRSTPAGWHQRLEQIYWLRRTASIAESINSTEQVS